MASHTTIEQKFDELHNAWKTHQYSPAKIQRVPEYLRNRKKFKEHYLPRLVSIGPIHHGNANLKLGEKYKLMWAAQYIEVNGLDSQNLYKKIVDKIDELKGLFAEDVLSSATRKSLKSFPSLNEKLSWMLFVDGCSLLRILVVNAETNYPKNIMKIKVDQHILLMMDVLLLENQLPYLVLQLLWKNENETELINTMKKFLNCCEQWTKPKDETELKGTTKDFLKFSHWATLVTKLKDTTKNFLKSDHSATPDNKRTRRSFRSHIQGCSEVHKNKEEEKLQHSVVASKKEEEIQHSVVISKKEEEEEILQSVAVSISFLSKKKHSISIFNESETESKLPAHLLDPTHLLDLQRKLILTKASSKTDGQKHSEEHTNEMITYRNIQDLRAVGIKFKSSATRRPTDIYFCEGWFAAELILPEIVVDDSTAACFLNLIAYEMCPDFDNDYEISSFVASMDSLIDHPEDVRKLRSEGILLNCLGSDKEVAKLFNIISKDLVEVPTYLQVRVKIDKHYKHKCKTWIALGIHTYFNNPWTFIAFLAAFIALALTFVQTWFTVNPHEKKK